jgi:ribose 5-phosphate isomerase A
MVLGLGTGSTIRHLLELLGEAIRSGRLARIVGVPTSEQTRSRARDAGIELVEFGAGVAPDLTIDGADEVSPSLDLIKGMGGALLREKMVAQASHRLVIIVDERKIVERLGTISPLPVEVVAWGMHAHIGFLETLGALVSIREDATGQVVLSDNGNAFFDCRFPEGIDDPAALEVRLARRAGIVDTGLFLGMADEVLIASDAGVRTMTRGG